MPAVAEPPHQSGTLTLTIEPIEPSRPSNVVLWPQLRREVTLIERHVLACVAVHTFNQRETVPYIPPTPHQLAVAQALAAPDVRLLLALPTRQASFLLSRLGERLIRQLYRFVPVEEDAYNARMFDQLRAMMRNDWEVVY